jgi:acetyltransferase-like isoleucine patch superfamily enzyme
VSDDGSGLNMVGLLPYPAWDRVPVGAPRPAVHGPVVFLRPHRICLHATARIDSFVKIEGGDGVFIGPSVHIASFAHVNVGGGTVILEEGAAVASGVRIVAGSNTMAGVSMSAAAPRELQVVEKRLVTIGRNAFLGVNAVIMPGVSVGARAVIGAGAVVLRDVPAGEVWAGVPARKVRDRDPKPTPKC